MSHAKMRYGQGILFAAAVMLLFFSSIVVADEIQSAQRLSVAKDKAKKALLDVIGELIQKGDIDHAKQWYVDYISEGKSDDEKLADWESHYQKIINQGKVVLIAVPESLKPLTPDGKVTFALSHTGASKSYSAVLTSINTAGYGDLSLSPQTITSFGEPHTITVSLSKTSEDQIPKEIGNYNIEIKLYAGVNVPKDLTTAKSIATLNVFGSINGGTMNDTSTILNDSKDKPDEKPSQGSGNFNFSSPWTWAAIGGAVAILGGAGFGIRAFRRRGGGSEERRKKKEAKKAEKLRKKQEREDANRRIEDEKDSMMSRFDTSFGATSPQPTENDWKEKPFSSIADTLARRYGALKQNLENSMNPSPVDPSAAAQSANQSAESKPSWIRRATQRIRHPFGGKKKGKTSPSVGDEQ